MRILAEFSRYFNTDRGNERTDSTLWEGMVEAFSKSLTPKRGAKRRKALLNAKQSFYLNSLIRILTNEKDYGKRLECQFRLFKIFDSLKITDLD